MSPRMPPRFSFNTNLTSSVNECTIMCNEMNNNNNWVGVVLLLCFGIAGSPVQDFNNCRIFPTYLFAPEKKVYAKVVGGGRGGLEGET